MKIVLCLSGGCPTAELKEGVILIKDDSGSLVRLDPIDLLHALKRELRSGEG